MTNAHESNREVGVEDSSCFLSSYDLRLGTLAVRFQAGSLDHISGLPFPWGYGRSGWTYVGSLDVGSLHRIPEWLIGDLRWQILFQCGEFAVSSRKGLGNVAATP